MSKHTIIVDFVSIARLARKNAGTAVGRNQQVQLVNAVFQGVLEAIDIEPSMVNLLTVWTDAKFGEGMLFKSISHDIPRMVTFRMDSESDLATMEGEMDSTVLRYRPSVVVVPLSWQDIESAPPAKRRRIRSMAARVLEKCRSEQLETAWDTGFTPVYTPDTAVDTVKVMTWIQDRGLDPSSWVFDLPISEHREAMMIAQAHIDGMADVKLLFRSVDDSMDAAIDRALRIDSLAKSRGVGQLYVGAPHFGASLERLMDDELTPDEVSSRVADILTEFTRKYDHETEAAEAGD